MEKHGMDLEARVGEDGEMILNSTGSELATNEENDNIEPYVGMEFDSEEAATKFYDAYARRAGFRVRVGSNRRSKRDGRNISRQLVCNKEGFRVKNENRILKPRKITREGCKAMIYVKQENSGKWVVAKLIKEHNHPMEIINSNSDGARSGGVRQCSLHFLSSDDKDKKIRELTCDLKREKRQHAACRERLLMVLKDIEEHKQQLSKKVEAMENSIRELDKSKNIHNI
eukprot:TRINITY_DN2322_c0_g2_i1.p1 TRINITY_DN2322_c0_g2~~TRINITY_DN2322_c0_g2_i1.p1  ORF type:complete len:228 (-),score=44.65 TRINITY_DN2322_c0_g2_i1:37-720(-)